jgi:hypothetical protein
LTWTAERQTRGKIMEIKKENGKIITTMTFSECFFGYDDPELSKAIIDRFDETILYPSQPDRLRRVDTGDSEAIVGSANIEEIAETSRND